MGVNILPVAALVLSDYLWLVSGLLYLAAIANLSLFVFVHYELVWVWRRKSKWFATEWKEQHPTTTTRPITNSGGPTEISHA